MQRSEGRRERRRTRRRGGVGSVAAVLAVFVLSYHGKKARVMGQPSATKLMTIPCTLVIPGNQQRVAPVYGLTECYLATVCIDQPVAADAIVPPPQGKPVTAPPSAQSSNDQQKGKDTGKQKGTGATAGAGGAGKMTGVPPPASSSAQSVKGVLASPIYLNEDKEDVIEAPEHTPATIGDMPGLAPGPSQQWNNGFGVKHARSLRGGKEGEQNFTPQHQQPGKQEKGRQQKEAGRRLAESDVGKYFGYREKGFQEEEEKQVYVDDYEEEDGDEEEGNYSNEWDFRKQGFVSPSDPVQAEDETYAYTGIVNPGGGSPGAATGATAGYAVNPSAPSSGPYKRDKQAGAGGGGNDGTAPTDPNAAGGGGIGDGNGDDGNNNDDGDTPDGTPDPDPANGGDDGNDDGGQSTDDYAGGVAEITVVRLCSREVVCQECGPINVVPRCTCSMVLYNPLTDPDYFLK